MSLRSSSLSATREDEDSSSQTAAFLHLPHENEGLAHSVLLSPSSLLRHLTPSHPPEQSLVFLFRPRQETQESAPLILWPERLAAVLCAACSGAPQDPWKRSSPSNPMDSVEASEGGNRLGEADCLHGDPRFPEIPGALGFKTGEPAVWLPRLNLVAALTASLYPLDDDTSCVARRPQQFPHSYIQGMSCCVLHQPGILRETQDRGTCEDLSYKQWKHLGGTGKENSFKRQMGKEMF